MLQRLQPNDKPKRKEFADNMLQRIYENENFSKDEELLTASNTDPISINFLYHRQIEERDGRFFPCLVLHLHGAPTSNFVSMNQDTHWALGLLLRSNHKGFI